MTRPRTEDLIVALAANVAPVRLLPSPVRRFALWLAASLAATAAAVLLMGVRHDIADAIADPSVVGDWLMLIAVIAAAGATAFALSVPGKLRSGIARVAPIGLAMAWLTWLLVRLTGAGGGWTMLVAEPWHMTCGTRVASMAIVPAIAAVLMIRRAAPLEPRWTAALAGVAAFAAGALGAELVCPLSAPAHLIVAHAVPFAVCSALSAAMPVGARME